MDSDTEGFTEEELRLMEDTPKRKRDRNAYMKDYMRKRSAAGKDKPQKITLTIDGRSTIYTKEALERLLSSAIPPQQHISGETLAKPKIVSTPPLTQRLKQRPTIKKERPTSQEREAELKKKHQLLMDLTNAGELDPESLALVNDLTDEANQRYVNMVEELDKEIFSVVERFSLGE
jgi:hypothetical protein